MSKYPLEDRVAARLAGRAVTIHHTPPPYTKALGSAHKQNGRAVIFVHPNLDPLTRLKTFLHELAHCRADWQHLPELDPATRPASIPSDPARRLVIVEGRNIEQAADQLAAAWLDFSDRHYPRYLARAEYDEITARLYALDTIQF